MKFIPESLPDYDQSLYELLHETLDQLIEVASKCNAHKDVLDMGDDELVEDEDGDISVISSPPQDVHPVRLLKAQLDLNGAEDELPLTQSLVQTLSNLIIVRQARRLINHSTPQTFE